MFLPGYPSYYIDDSLLQRKAQMLNLIDFYINIIQFFSKKKKRNFIHLSRSKLHLVYSHPGEFQSPKNGTKI